MDKKEARKQDIVIYQAPSGAIELRGDFKRDTIWATQDQIGALFSTTKQNISQHFKSIFKSGELDENSVVKDFFTTASDGKQYKVQFYDLDAILAVGYRVNSKNATQFRKWATKTLREHIVQGFTVNRFRIAKNYDAFLKTVEQVKALLPAGMASDTGSILELVKAFADTWVSLNAYDKGSFPRGKTTKKKVSLVADDLLKDIAKFKTQLMKQNEATDLFAQERSSGSIEGIVGNVMQGFGGKDVYPNIEEKSAHLLYFMVKNHPFTDGNKRSGAFAFVWFLKRTGALNARITPATLTALTLLIAESNPKDKEKMIGLVAMLLGK